MLVITSPCEVIGACIPLKKQKLCLCGFGNLLQVTLPDHGQGAKTIDYLVDGSNRRVGKKVGGVLQQGWLYAGQLAPVAELDADNRVVARFVYASKVNVPDYMVKGGITYRFITEQL